MQLKIDYQLFFHNYSMEKNQYRTADLRIIFYISMLAIFVIGILLLTLAEPFKINWIIGLGFGIGAGFITMRLIMQKFNS